MTFRNYSDTGRVSELYGSLPVAQKWARAMLAGDKRIKVVEIRPLCSPAGNAPYAKSNKGSFYRNRKDMQQG